MRRVGPNPWAFGHSRAATNQRYVGRAAGLHPLATSSTAVRSVENAAFREGLPRIPSLTQRVGYTLQTMFENARRLRRSARVARTGARIYLGYKITERKVRKMPPDAAATEWDRRHERFAESLYRLAVDLRGLYVKAGQFIGTRSDLLPVQYSLSLIHISEPTRPY